MTKYLILSLLFSLGMVLCLNAQSILLSDMTPSATALNGLTIVCESASDNGINPTTAASGSTTYYINPFSLNKVSVYGLHTSQWISVAKVAAGTAYLNSTEYIHSDYYINMGVCLSGITLGYTRHWIFTKVDEDEDIQTGDDWGLRYDYVTGAAEAIYRQSGNEDEFAMNALWRISNDLNLGGGILLDSDREKSYRFGTSFTIGNALILLSSWQSNPSRLGFGIKLHLESSDLTYAIRTHNELSSTHAVEFGYRW